MRLRWLVGLGYLTGLGSEARVNLRSPLLGALTRRPFQLRGGSVDTEVEAVAPQAPPSEEAIIGLDQS